MTLKHIVTDLHQVYLTEMEAKIKPKSTAGAGEKKSGDSEGGTAEDQVKKAARQLAYDTRYKARRDGIPLEKAFTQTLQNSSASSPVKELAKGMLFGGGQKEEVEKISEKPELPPEIYAALRRLENKRQRQGGDKKDSPFPSDRKEKEVKKESIGTAIDKTLGAAGEVADTAVKFPVKAAGYVAGLKKGLKKQFKKGQSKANEHHEKDADGKVIEHDIEDTAPSSLDEAKTKAKGGKKGKKKKDKVLVTPVQGQGKAYRRYADAKKKYELRKNPQISSVTGTAYGKTYDEKPEDKKNPGKFPQQKKAKKDFDGDGKLETSKKEWEGSRDKAIKKSIKKQKNEEFSNWKEEFDLTEIIKKDSQPKKIQELKGKNTIIINPKLEEGIDVLGGYVLDFYELNEEHTEQSIDLAADYFVEEGINEEGLDLIIEEVGVEAFTEFVYNFSPVSLDEAVRDMKKAPKRDYEKVKASVYKKDAERKAKGTGEYSKTKAAKDKYGDEDNTVHDDDAPAPKKKGGAIVKSKSSAIVKTAAKKAKEKQPEKKPEKKGIVGKIRDAVGKGMERHKAATKELKKTAKATAKQHSQHRKDFVKGITPTSKEKKIAGGVAKAAKKALTGEEVEHIDELKSSTLSSYVSKAIPDALKSASHSGAVSMSDGPDSKRAKKDRDKAWKRGTGIRRASSRLANRAIRGGQEDSTKKMAWEEVQEDLHPNIKRIDAMSKANVAKQAAKAKADKSAREKTAAAFQKHKASVLAKGGRPVDALDSWNKKKVSSEAIDPRGGGSNPDLSVKQQNTEKKQTDNEKEKLRKKRELIQRMRQQDVAQGRQPSGHTARESVIIDNDKEDSLNERLGGKGYSRKAAASSVYPGKKSTGDWPDSDRGEGNKAARRAGKPVKAKSPTYIAYVKNKKANEALDLKKDDAGSAPADKKAEGMNKQIERKEKKVAVMKRQILQKKVQAVRAGAGGDVVAHFEPSGTQITENPVVDVVKKGVERHKKATKRKKKGVNYELMAQEFDPKGTEVTELNRYEKETGKSSGSLNMPKGRPTKKGGDDDPVMRAVRSSIRKETGKPEGQRKKKKGAKSDVGTGKYLAKQKAKKDYAAKAKKAGFKSTQDYTNTMARYGGEDNYKAGRGLGT